LTISKDTAQITGHDRLFELRWNRSERDLLEPFRLLYGTRPKVETQLKEMLARHWKERPSDLKDRDLQRDLEPAWFLSEKMVGYVFYVDRFAGTLNTVLDHVDYLKSLGTTYVHFMPCLKPRPGNSDGGYSVMDYRSIDPRLGTMADFEHVASELRKNGMDVCIDLVLNHTAKEHEWAEKAKRGEKKFQDYYWMFDSDETPKAHEESLIEIFPNDAPGSFTYYPSFKKWVWTTFNEHQWDLNWANPHVFLEIVDIMLTLANKGATCLRLDAVAFMWKRMGTTCQNQPEVHDILQALRAATRIAAPAMIHKAEAIVAPKDLVPYLGRGRHTGREGNLAYHNNLMVQFWSSLATQQTALMSHVLATHFPESFKNASFATYLRCHDDIGWAITEEDAAAIPHMSGPGHRRYLADFYAGQHPGSYARGGIFQENAETGDRRNSGSLASLAGLESAKAAKDETAIEMALHRILLGYALICSFGGMPLLYMGDEIGLLNDYGFSKIAEHAHDNRWLHRPLMDWTSANTPIGPDAKLLVGVKAIIARRKELPALAASVPTRVLHLGLPAVFAYARLADTGTLVCVFNFSDSWQRIPAEILKTSGVVMFRDELGQADVTLQDGYLAVAPYGRLWLS
jgi:amylosucrase